MTFELRGVSDQCAKSGSMGLANEIQCRGTVGTYDSAGGWSTLLYSYSTGIRSTIQTTGNPVFLMRATGRKPLPWSNETKCEFSHDAQSRLFRRD